MADKAAARRSTALTFSVRYCEEVVAFMGQGFSLTAFAGEIGASRALLQAWCDKHPSFAEAVERGQAKRARVLENSLLAGKGAAAFGAHMQALRTAAPDEWPAKGGAVKAGRRGVGKPSSTVDLPDNGRS